MSEIDRHLDEIKRILETRATRDDMYRGLAVSVCVFSVVFCITLGALLWWGW